MKALLARRPASSSSSTKGSSSNVSQRHHGDSSEQEDGNFYYPSALSTSAAAGDFTRRDSGRATLAKFTPEDGLIDIASTPPSRAPPPSSWTRNKSRFSISRPGSSGKETRHESRPKLNSSESDCVLLAASTSAVAARPEGLLRAASAPTVAETPASPLSFSSYDDRVRDRLERTRRREIVSPHRMDAGASEEKRTSPIIFLVSNPDGRVDRGPNIAMEGAELPKPHMPVKSTQDTTRRSPYENLRPLITAPKEDVPHGNGNHNSCIEPPESPLSVDDKHSASFQGSSARSTSLAEPERGTDGLSFAIKKSYGKRFSRLGLRASFGSHTRSEAINSISNHSARPAVHNGDGTESIASSSLIRSRDMPKGESLPELSHAELACHLSELAISHGNALMSDEEYRLLRESLFERTQNSTKDVMPVKSATSVFWESARAALDSEQAEAAATIDEFVSHPVARQGIIEQLEGQHMLAQSAPVAIPHRQSTKGSQSSARGSLQQSLSAGAIPLFRKAHSRVMNKLGDDKRPLATNDAETNSSAFKVQHTVASSFSYPASSRTVTTSLPSPGSLRSTMSATSSTRPDCNSFFIQGSRGRAGRLGLSDSASFASSFSPSTNRRLTSGISKEDAEGRRRRLERAVQETRSIHSQKGARPALRRRTVNSVSGQGRQRTYSTPSSKSSAAHGRPTAQGPSSDVPPLPPESAILLAAAAGLDEQDVEYGEKSSEMIQAEMRILEAEGKRIADRFHVLESGLVEKGERLLQDVRQDGMLNGAEYERQRQGAMRWLRTGVWPPADMVEVPSPTSKRGGRPLGTLRRLSSALLTSAASSRAQTANLLAREEGSGEKAALRKESSATSAFGLAHLEIPADLHSLRKELANVQSRREDVARRYEERILFLASKDRAAKLRERFA